MSGPDASPPRPRPGRFRRWLLRPVAWLLAGLALLVALGNFLARTEAAGERIRTFAERRLSLLLEREIRIGTLSLSLLPLSLEATDVAVAAGEPGGPALAEVGRLEVEADLTGLWRPTLTLRRVRIERPVFRLALLEEGETNLPLPRGAGSRDDSSPGRLALRVDGLEVVDGRFELAETTVPLTLHAAGVEAELAASRGSELLGRVEVAAVEIVLPQAHPWQARVAGRLRLRPDGLDLHEVEVAGEALTARLGGEVRWREADRVELTGQVRTAAAFARALGYLDAPLDGEVVFDGGFRWAAVRGWEVEGSFTSPRVELGGLLLTDAAGEVTVDAEAVAVRVRAAALCDGTVEGSLRFDYPQTDTPTRIDLTLAGVELEQLLASREIELGAPLDARLTGAVELAWQLADLRTLAGRIDLAAAPGGRPGAVAAAGPVTFTVANGRLHARRLALAGDGFELAAEGEYDVVTERGGFDYLAVVERLRPFTLLLPVEREPAPLWLPVAGGGTIEGRLDLGATVTSELRLALEALRAPGFAAARAGGTLQVTPDGIAWLELTAEGAEGETLRLSGQVPFAEEEPFSLAVTVAGWPYAGLAPWLPVELPLDGPVSGEVALSGSLEAPRGSASVDLRPVLAAGIAAEALTASLAFTPERLDLDRLVLTMPAGELRAEGTLDLATDALAIRFEAPALALGLPPLDPFGDAGLHGGLDLQGRLTGTLDHPQLAATLTATALNVGGEPLAVPLAPELVLDWHDDRLAVSGALCGLIGVTGGGPLTLDDADLDLRLDVPDLPALAAALGGGDTLALTGSAGARLAVHGALAGEMPLTARLVADRAAVGLAGRELTLIEPAVVELDAAGVRIASLYLGEPASDSELFATGTVTPGDEGRLDLRVQARLAAALLVDVIPGLTASGDLELLAAVRGTLERPRLSGQAELSGGRFRFREFPHTFERARAMILLDPDRIVIDSFTAELAGGRLRGGGNVRLDTAEPEYSFQLAAEEVGLRYPPGWLLRTNADLTLVSQPQGRTLRGTVTLARAFYLRDFPADLGQLLVRLLERQRLEAAATDEALAGTALQVTLSAPHALRIRNNVADLRGGADLTIRGTLAQPAIFGRIEAEPGGKIVYAGTDYELERARVTLANPARIEPVIDLDARTKVEQYELHLRLAGTLERLDVNFTSDPPLPSLDVFGLLAVGEVLPTEGAGPVGPGSDAAQASSFGAEAILYNQAAAIVSSRVQGLFGLDKLRIDPLTTSRNVVSSARVTVGKRLSRDVYVTYTLDPASTEQQQVQLEWQINPGLVLVLTQNGEESYAADLRWQRRF